MTDLVVGFELEGLHYWPEAPDKYKEFETEHRHVFKILCFFKTEDSADLARREVELFDLRRSCIEELRARFGVPCRFGARSCEGIADTIQEVFNASRVFVGEDWGIGAYIY